jgi:hypothetical protein
MGLSFTTTCYIELKVCGGVEMVRASVCIFERALSMVEDKTMSAYRNTGVLVSSVPRKPQKHN